MPLPMRPAWTAPRCSSRSRPVEQCLGALREGLPFSCSHLQRAAPRHGQQIAAGGGRGGAQEGVVVEGGGHRGEPLRGGEGTRPPPPAAPAPPPLGATGGL